MRSSAEIPKQLQGERAILGALLQFTDTMATAARLIQASDFQYDKNKKLFESLTKLYNSGTGIDFVTAWRQVQKDGEYMTPMEVCELGVNVCSPVHFEHHCRCLKEISNRKYVINASEDLKKKTSSGDFMAADLTGMLEDIAVRTRNEADGVLSSEDVLNKTLKEMVSDSDPGVFLTDIKALNEIIWKARPGNLIVLAGRTGMGKTMMVNTVLKHLAIQKGLRVLFWSLEMPDEENMQRLMSTVSGIRYQDILRGIKDVDVLAEAFETIRNAKIYWKDQVGVTALDIKNQAIEVSKTRGLDFMVIDYGGLINHMNPNGHEVTEIGNTTKMLKQTAKDLKIPILLVWQLNRAVESRTDKRPFMSELRASGRIEEDADKVILLYRPESYDKGEIEFEGKMINTNRVAIAFIDKNRNGKVGKCLMSFDPDHCQFTTYSAYDSMDFNTPF